MPRPRAPRWSTVASVVTGLFLAICLYRLVDDVNLYNAAQALKAAKVEALARLEARRDETRELADKLQSDPMTKERLARSVGYISPGETVYFIPPTAPTPPASTAAE
ncbi:hypothetical protein HN371_05340 [Candidatus Poribacteria bacterium]|jgi:cell division protein FtsB|nr:hypothetical protein [Candidatus Poribacteria bacterium]MBT5534441.1 hypothetical protein [Candidatus Poribacteria bacterium]MBT5711629.1 hypothetical protein [Candidatus Poribacteria bacterium]MBT7099312.1 hypothetical protein [Candidatus Poribacteria bacterium]MBT7809500.1 hypothetical protein [Candidatus Poribacteria bacterium]